MVTIRYKISKGRCVMDYYRFIYNELGKNDERHLDLRVRLAKMNFAEDYIIELPSIYEGFYGFRYKVVCYEEKDDAIGVVVCGKCKGENWNSIFYILDNKDGLLIIKIINCAVNEYMHNTDAYNLNSCKYGVYSAVPLRLLTGDEMMHICINISVKENVKCIS